MSWQCEALVIGRDGAQRSVVVSSEMISAAWQGRVVWAVEPGGGCEIGRIAVEEGYRRRGYEVRVDGVLVRRTRNVELALSVARGIEAYVHGPESLCP